MSGRRLPLRSSETDPLDDPLNLGWDAIVRNERPAAADIDPDDFDLLRRVQAQANRALPDPHFFGELEHRLEGLYSISTPKPRQRPRVGAGSIGTPPKSLARTMPLVPSHRWFPLASPLAAVVLLLVIVAFAIPRLAPEPSAPVAIPAAMVAKPELQPLIQFDFDPPMWGMPDATTWTHMDFSIIELAPGKSFDTTAYWYTSAQGPLLLMVLSGELSMQPAGPALFYPDIERQQQPEQVAPGETVTMAANSAIAYSIADTGSGTNPGSVPMVALIGLTGKEDLSLPYSKPTEVRSLSFEYVDGMTVPPTKGAHVSIQRLRLAPFDSFVFDPDQDWRYLPALDPSHVDGLQLATGAISGISPSLESRRVVDSFMLHDPTYTPLTLFNLGEESVDIYFFVVEPYPPPTTPTP